ncbi:MAG: DNA methyltransferase [Porticoccus sp.]|nr:MAG: DNA methyltransferase [Porticoccus sp.]
MMNQYALPINGTPVSSKVKPFRTLHYLGSKLRLLDFIKTVVDEVDPKGGGICDLFSGSGAVAQHFSKERKVVSVDIQEYSRVICSALLNPFDDSPVYEFAEKIREASFCSEYLSKIAPIIDIERRVLHGDFSSSLETVCDFLESCSLYSQILLPRHDINPLFKKPLLETASNIWPANKHKFLVTSYFGGVFFSFKQAAELDVILNGLNFVDLKYHDLLKASVLSTASDIVNTVGKQFAQPIRPRNKSGEPKKGLLSQLNKDRSLEVFPIFSEWVERYATNKVGRFSHKVVCSDFRAAIDSLENDVSVVYADPPYTRDHYSRFYHGLETLARMDFPEISMTNLGDRSELSRGLYRKDRHQSDFCIKSRAVSAFNDLFYKVSSKQKVLLLSYSPYEKDKGSHPRVVELEFLLDMASKHFNSVELRSMGKFSHSKLNRTDLHLKAGDTAEVLIVCR